MLFLTNLLITVVVMTVLAVDVFGIIALSGWAGDKWGSKGFISVVSVLIFLPMMILHALAMTYGS